MDKKLGFLGLGLMGLPMSCNIVKKLGVSMKGYDVVKEKKAEFKKAGGTPVDDPMEIFTTCDIIMTSLPNHAVTIDIIEGAIANGKHGNIIIDFSSTAPHITKDLYEKAKAAGIYMLDSPISGGEPGAKGGTLAVMTGGEKEIFDEVKPILEAIGFPVYTGKSTTGSVAKLANNMIVGAMLSAYVEAYAFAEKAGLAPDVLFEATRSGFCGGPLYENKIPKLYNRDFTPGARIAVHYKDILNAKHYAHKLGVDLPITDVTTFIMEWIKDHGLIDIDQIGMVKYFEEKMGVTVEKKS